MLTAGATFMKFGVSPRYNPRGPSERMINFNVPTIPTDSLLLPTTAAKMNHTHLYILKTMADGNLTMLYEGNY